MYIGLMQILHHFIRGTEHLHTRSLLGVLDTEG
jgi:hypothetical protein